MPRLASRITLEVIAARKELLHAITEEDAIAEGMREPSLRQFHPSLGQAAWSERQVFSRLWEAINGKGSWEANPEIFVVTFKTHKVNIDQFLAQREVA